MELKSIRESKERGMSVQEAIDYAQEHELETTEIIIMAVDKEGNIKTAYSTESLTTMLGVMEQTKHMILDAELYE